MMNTNQFDEYIRKHIGRMWGGLEMSSIEYFMKTGTVNGNFRNNLIAMISEVVLDYQKEALRESILMQIKLCSKSKIKADSLKVGDIFASPNQIDNKNKFIRVVTDKKGMNGLVRFFADIITGTGETISVKEHQPMELFAGQDLELFLPLPKDTTN